MTLRSQAIAAFGVLLVALVAVLALVGDAGVQSTVFSANSTATVTPTPTPSPTPVPVASAENWAESDTEPGVWTYTLDPSVAAQITVAEKSVDQAAADLGVPPPPDDAPLPGLAILTSLGSDLGAQIASQPDAGITLESPATKLYGGQPVSILRFNYGPDLNPNYPDGIDVALGMIDLGDDQVNTVELFVGTGPNDDVYADFEAWLNGNMAMLTGAEAETTDETGDGDADTGLEGEGDTDVEGDTETDADTESEGETDADTDADTETETGAETGETSAETEADADSAPAPTWIEVGPGQLIYAANQNVAVVHNPVTVDQLVTSLALDPESDLPSTPIELLAAMKTNLATRYEEVYGETIPADAFEGPANVTYGNVQMAELRLTVEAGTDTGGQPIPAQRLRQYLIDLGGGNLYRIQFLAQDEIEDSVEADFEAWLIENAPIFAETEPASE